LADQRPRIEEMLARRQTSARALILDILLSLDGEDYLRSAGLADDDFAALRGRLLGVPSRSA
jgi:hypothetical protein